MKDVLNDNSNIERKDSIFSFYKQVNYQELLTHKVLAMKSLPLINAQLSKHNLGKISTRLRQDLQLLESKNQIKEISNRYKIEDSGINTEYSDFGAAFVGDNFVFTSTRDTGSVAKIRHKWTNQS